MKALQVGTKLDSSGILITNTNRQMYENLLSHKVAFLISGEKLEHNAGQFFATLAQG